MKSQQERLEQLHTRAAELKEQKERRTVNALKAVAVMLFVCLAGVMSVFSGLQNAARPENYTGSSLLDSSVGGYVLVAVMAFAAAVVITVICMKRKDRKKRSKHIRRRLWKAYGTVTAGTTFQRCS